MQVWGHERRPWTDIGFVALVFAVCLAAEAASPGPLTARDVLLQGALLTPLIWRSRAPGLVYAVIASVALVQWFVAGPLLADCALLLALFSLTLLASPVRALLGGAVLMLGVVMASLRWVLTGDVLHSIVFMTGFVIAALSAGVAARTWRSYSEAQSERTRRLEFERDQQAKLATAAERSRIAREMHDVVAHNVSIMVTLADAALAKADTHLDSAKEAVADVAATGRHALADMRQILGVLSTDGDPAGAREPQPQLSGIPPLIDRVRGTGLNIEFGQFGNPFDLPPSVQLSIYRIVQESLTNVLKHADEPSEAKVRLSFDAPAVEVSVFDDGRHTAAGTDGHGVSGMHERAAFCGGTLTAGPQPGKGWEVKARLRADQ
jgi:signal transduction histidine kinase